MQPQVKEDISQVAESASQSTEVTGGVVSQAIDLQEYQLARYKERRFTKPPKRYAYANMVAYALMSAEDVSIKEPNSYAEALSSKDNNNWIKAITE